MAGKRGPGAPLDPATRITRAGRDRSLTGGMVNPVVQRGSTVLIERAEDLYAPGVWTYGISGTSTHTALKQAMCELESASECLLVSTGLLACTLPILAFIKPGDHVLICDNVYGPTRRFADRTLGRLGVEVEYFDPAPDADFKSRLKPNTRIVFLESPGSLTFEICDTPKLAALAREAGAISVLDNTWGAGLYHKPLDLGVDISVQATSKYVGGSADLLGGAILTNSAKLSEQMAQQIQDLGLTVSPDDAWLALRGLRSLIPRLERHAASGLEVARWLQQQPGVQRVLHPALPEDASHALWKRDFTGCAGLFGVVLDKARPSAVNAFLNALDLFGLGFSWGGFESLAIPVDPQLKRTASRKKFEGPIVRLSIGLEAPGDLIADLDRGLSAFRAAKG
jgi:cystathionine beta-lyase